MNTERATQLWNDTTVLLNRESGRSHLSLNAMFSSLVAVDINEDELILSTSNLFTKDWVERRLTEAIHEAIWSVSGIRYGFRIVISDPPDEPAAAPLQATSPLQTAAPLTGAAVQAAAPLPVAAVPAAAVPVATQHSPSIQAIPQPTNIYTGPAAGAAGFYPQQTSAAARFYPQSNPSQDAVYPVAIPEAAGAANAITSFLATSAPASQIMPARQPLQPSLLHESSLAFSQSLESPERSPQSPEILPQATTLSSLPGQTFETFVVGEANKRAFDMAYCVAEASGYIINPLFIYGRSGLGKTHLLLSIRHYIQTYHPELSVLYIQTSDLVAEYSQSARRGDFNDFNNRFSSIDVFLLDDVQLLERRVETTNTVFDVFNRLTSTNRQVVLSADRSPDEIDLHERYLSRFKNGATADIQPPSFETKLTIFSNYLDYRCRRFNREDVRQLIRPDVIEYIVSLSGSNIRELEGAATNLVWSLCSEDKNRYLPISIEEAEAIVGSHFRKQADKTIDIATIQKEVEDFFGVSHSDIMSTKRSQDISYPRQVAMYLCRLLTTTSLPSVGNAFKKDHTAVMYACNNIEKKRLTSSKVNSEIKQLIDNITG